MKKIIKHINSTLPDIFNNFASILKENFDKNGQEILQSGTGTAVIIAKLFGQPIIDKYFNQLSEKKLENHGLNTYIKSGFMQANESLAEIEEHLKKELDPEAKFDFLNQGLRLEGEKLKKEDILLIFNPKYHPTIIAIKRHYENVLRELQTPSDAIKSFTKHFNEHIEDKVKEEFGDDYKQHLNDTKTFRLRDSETDFLWDMVSLEHIGFKGAENLPYEKTYARWRAVLEFKSANNEQNDFEAEEKELKPIQELIEYYFKQDKHHTRNILFVLADFGKGKSIFLRQYAAKLARQYFETKEGLFPVYFNLRDFSHYSSETELGVISDYLETDYGIKINDDHFKNNQYIFLIDSLDESGELTQQSIDKVIASIKKIQNIDTFKQRTNRIVLSSRPFDDGLETHLSSHKPYIIKNKEDRDIPYFISIYGFKKQQFNHWLKKTLKQDIADNKIQICDLSQEVKEIINSDNNKDFYQLLQNNKTLSASELRRPIFSYMIYQLIINKIDFSTIGKIGVYLSFINLLTKDAKHIHDINYKVNLAQEFQFRNLLHSISALWMYQRQQGKQGALKKADICRVLDGENNNESDSEVLGRYKKEDITEIQFLSHSYFGNNKDVLHFHHQSFAEILLAEYYLKVFIKYALDKDHKVEEARTKLILGEPTAQTIQFLTEMLSLLKETATDDKDDKTIEKRKLLFPLMASLATEKNNKLFCNDLYYSWFKDHPCNENEAIYPREALENWCINQEKLDKIIKLAREIIESKTNYIMAKSDARSSLYDKELVVIQPKNYTPPPDIDRWLALLIGNKLQTDIESNTFFNEDIKNYKQLFDMIKDWNHATDNPAPIWATDLFMGINMRGMGHAIKLVRLNLRYIDFSYSIFRTLWLVECRVDFMNLGHVSGLGTCHFQNIVEFEVQYLINFSDIWSNAQGGYEMNTCDRYSIERILSYKALYARHLKSEAYDALPIHEPVILQLIRYGIQHNKFLQDTVDQWLDDSKMRKLIKVPS